MILFPRGCDFILLTFRVFLFFCFFPKGIAFELPLRDLCRIVQRAPGNESGGEDSYHPTILPMDLLFLI